MTTYDFLSAKQAILNRLQFDPISHLVNFWHELSQIKTTYESLWWISGKAEQIMTTYEFLGYGEVILSTLFEASPTLPTWNGSNIAYLEWINYHTLMLKMVLFEQQP